MENLWKSVGTDMEKITEILAIWNVRPTHESSLPFNLFKEARLNKDTHDFFYISCIQINTIKS